MVWQCDGCGAVRECDPLAGDDWGGVMRAIGPDCEECGGIPMDLVEDDTQDEGAEDGGPK